MANNSNRLLKSTLALAILPVAVGFAFPSTAFAGTTSWIVGDSSWDTGENWSAGTPGPSSDVVISPASNPVLVTGPGSTEATVNSLTIGGSQNASLFLNAASLTVSNATTVDANGYLALFGTHTLNTASLLVNGTFDISGAAAGSTLPGLSGNGTISLGDNSLTLNNAANIFTGSINGRGGLILPGGTQTLAGTNTYTGLTSIKGGVLQLDGGAAIAPANAVSVDSGGTLELLHSQTIGSLAGTAGSQVRLNENTLTTGDDTSATFAGSIKGTGGLVKQGLGSFALSGSNTYTGPTQISAGTLLLQGGAAIADTGAVDVSDAGTLELAAKSSAGTIPIDHSETIGSLTGETGSQVKLNDNTLTTGDATDTTFAGVISGTGGLVKQGSGIFTLSGSNTYTGTTQVLGGILALDGDNTLATPSSLVVQSGTFDLGGHSQTLKNVQLLNGSIANGNLASTLDYDLQAGTVSANLGGTAGLQKTGAGTVVLTGDNSYVGQTNLNEGTLQIGNGGTTGSLISNILNNGTLTFNRSDTSGYTGTITGNGTLIKLGGGLLNLNNNINLQNPIQVDGGTLAVHKSVSTASALILGSTTGSSGQITLGDGASLSADTETVGSQGIGSLIQNGGTHTIAKTLSLGLNPGANGSYSLNNGQLTVGTQLGIGATGVFTVSGGNLQAGTINNQGIFNYSGGTVLANLNNQGTTNLSGTGTRTITGNVSNEGTFNVHETSAVFTGDFTNNGAYISDPSTNQFHNLNVGAQGYLSGGTDDTFIVTGDFKNASTQNTAWNTGHSDLIFKGPNAEVSAQHLMELAGEDKGAKAAGALDNYTWRTVTLSSGDQLSLADGNTTPGAALYTRRVNLPGGVSELNNISSDFNVYYDPTLPENAYLQGRSNFGSGSGKILPYGFVPFSDDTVSDPVLDTNQHEVAKVVNNVCASPSAAVISGCVRLQSLAPQQQKAAIAALTPDQTTSQISVPVSFGTTSMNTILLRLANLRQGGNSPFSFNLNGVHLPTEKLAKLLGMNPRGGAAGDGDEPFRDSPLGVFIQSRFNLGDMSGNSGSRGFEFQSRNVTIGADYRFSDQFVAGMAFNYTSVSTHYSEASGNSDTNAYTGAIYGSYYLPADFYVDVLANYGGTDYSLVRKFRFAGFSGSTQGRPGGDQYSFAVSGGKDFHWQEWLVSPILRWEYLNMSIDSYQEQGGGGFAMAVNAQNSESLIQDVGLQVSHAISLPFGVLTPSLRFEWEHQYLNDNRAIQMRLRDAKEGLGVFNVQTGQPDRDYFNLGGSVSATLPHGGSGFIRYESRLGQSYMSEHIVEAGVRLSF